MAFKPSSPPDEQAGEPHWRTLAEFNLTSEPGNERQAMDQVAEAVRQVDLIYGRVERLKTAVAEATMNAMEHGNHYQKDLLVNIQVFESPQALCVRITDQSGGEQIPEHITPDLEAKLAGLQSPRGWGLFLIESMVDELHIQRSNDHHTIELVFNKQGGGHGRPGI